MNVRPEENVGGKLLNISLGNDFLDFTSKAKATKAKINKWDYIKLERFCIVKEAINKMKGQPTEREEVFPNHNSDKGIISRIRKEFLQQQQQTTRLKNGQRI